jgi:prophage regulatory protein
MTTILRKIETAKRVGYSTRHIDRLAREDRFPKPVRLGGDCQNGAVGFIEAEVEQWLKGRISASRPSDSTQPEWRSPR